MKRLLLITLAWAGAASADEFVALQMRVTASGHELLGAQRFRAPQLHGQPATAGPQLAWQLLDGQGQVLFQGNVGDPRVVRGLFEPGKGHETRMQASADYMLRVPVDARAADLRLAPLTKAASMISGPRAQQAAGETPGVPAQRIDVRGLMQPPR